MSEEKFYYMVPVPKSKDVALTDEYVQAMSDQEVTEEEERLQNELDAAKRDLKELEMHRDGLENVLSTFIAQLNNNDSIKEIVSEMNRMNDEYMALVEDRIAEDESSIYPNSEAEQDHARKDTESVGSTDGITGSQSISKEVKKLYRKISAKTHPDKVKSKVLNDLFIEATTMAKFNNYAGLLEIWECVKARKSARAKRAEAYLLQHKKKIKEVEDRLAALANSDMFKLLQIKAKTGSIQPALMSYRQYMMSKKSELQVSLAAERANKTNRDKKREAEFKAKQFKAKQEGKAF